MGPGTFAALLAGPTSVGCNPDDHNPAGFSANIIKKNVVGDFPNEC
jgi:hypothetical protein